MLASLVWTLSVSICRRIFFLHFFLSSFLCSLEEAFEEALLYTVGLGPNTLFTLLHFNHFPHSVQTQLRLYRIFISQIVRLHLIQVNQQWKQQTPQVKEKESVFASSCWTTKTHIWRSTGISNPAWHLSQVRCQGCLDHSFRVFPAYITQLLTLCGHRAIRQSIPRIQWSYLTWYFQVDKPLQCPEIIYSFWFQIIF